MTPEQMHKMLQANPSPPVGRPKPKLYWYDRFGWWTVILTLLTGAVWLVVYWPKLRHFHFHFYF
jgi:hypothetical protein